MSTILVVEDMAVFREPIAAALRQKGYETLCVENGAKALQVLDAHRVDLVLLDVAMPVMDGLTFLRALRASAKHMNTPVVLLTAVTERGYVIEAGKLGVRDYLLKSRFSLAELFARVDKHLGPPIESPASPKPAATSRPPAEARVPRQPAGHADLPRSKPPAAPQAPAVAAPAPPPAVNVPALEALRSINPIMTRAQLTSRVESFGELKALSPTVGQLLKLTQSASCSIERVAAVINQDQAIALKVLKLANSAVYARGEPVESVVKAVMRIGLSQIRQVVLNISVIERFSTAELLDRFNAELFWEHSIATGLISAAVARCRGGTDQATETAFTIGLLHDVGRMVLANELGPEYARVLKTAFDLRLPLEQVETRMLEVNHADFMDKVLHAWEFPKHLINPIALHHLSMPNMRTLTPSTIDEVSTLALANRLAHALLLGSSGNQAVYPTEDFVRALKLRTDDVQRIVRDVPEQTSELKLVMLAASSRSFQDPRANLRKQLAEAGGLRPIIASMDPEIDAHAILADTLRDTSDKPPNIVIARIESARDRVKLAAQIKAQEEAARVQKLPLIVISPAGNVRLDESTMAGRAVELLPSPVALDRFIEAATRLLAAHAEAKPLAA